MGRAVLSALVLVIAFAAPADAGEVTVKQVPLGVDERGQDPSWSYVKFHGAPGEANAVTVTGGRPVVLLRDLGAVLTTGPGCRALSAHEAECRSPRFPLTAVFVNGGDGNDALTDGTGLMAQLSGGTGDDLLAGDGSFQYGDDGADRLSGGDAVDILEGGRGSDEIRGGGGSDRITGDPGGPDGWADVLDGGPGPRDVVTYEERTDGVTIDLARPGPQRQPGEGDILTGFEDAAGGDGRDVILGDDGPNTLTVNSSPGVVGDRIEGRAGDDRLWGSAGHDRLVGGQGDDWLQGNRGADAYTGGPGDDRLFLSLAPFQDPTDTARARIACGPGTDLVADPDARTLVPRDCERVLFEYVELRFRAAGARRLVFTLHPTHQAIPYCRVATTVARQGRRLARRDARVREPRRNAVLLRWRRAAPRVVVRLRGTFGCRPRAGRRIGAFVLAL